MKRGGIIIIAIMIVFIVALSGTTYAFYSTGKVEFKITIASGSGSVLSLNLGEQDTILAPPETNSSVDNYAAVTGDKGDYAVYCLDYVSTSSTDISVDFYATNVTYKDSSGSFVNVGYKNYLNDHIQYGFVIKEDTFALKDISSSDYPTTWIKASTGTEKITISNIANGKGKILCFVRFDLSEELLPPPLYGTKIAFTIGTNINWSWQIINKIWQIYTIKLSINSTLLLKKY